jgi:hypothetical protein
MPPVITGVHNPESSARYHSIFPLSPRAPPHAPMPSIAEVLASSNAQSPLPSRSLWLVKLLAPLIAIPLLSVLLIVSFRFYKRRRIMKVGKAVRIDLEVTKESDAVVVSKDDASSPSTTPAPRSISQSLWHISSALMHLNLSSFSFV